MTVSTHASAQAPLPVFVPPKTRRFSAVSGRDSHRYDVGWVSDRSGKREGDRCQEMSEYLGEDMLTLDDVRMRFVRP